MHQLRIVAPSGHQVSPLALAPKLAIRLPHMHSTLPLIGLFALSFRGAPLKLARKYLGIACKGVGESQRLPGWFGALLA